MVAVMDSANECQHFFCAEILFGEVLCSVEIADLSKCCKEGRKMMEKIDSA